MPDTSMLDQNDPLVGSLAKVAPTFRADELFVAGSSCVPDVARACADPGVFYIELDSTLQRVVDGTLAEMGRFFSLDDNHPIKRRALAGEGDSGWIPRYMEPAYQPGTTSSLEAFDCSTSDVRDPREGSFWPELPGFRAAVTACWSGIFELGLDVLDALADAAGAAPGCFRRHCSSGDLNTLRLLHYAPVAPRDPKRNVGIAAHTDFECITLLYQTAPGLELRTTSGGWHDAPHTGGRLVVLLGDMLERWTNGRLQATGHRVRETAARRYSIVMFMAVDDGVTVAPLPAFVSDTSPSRYEASTQRQHIDDEMRRAREQQARERKEASA